VAAGASLSDKEIRSINWLVAGINGPFPKS